MCGNNCAFILVLFIYATTEILVSVLHKVQLNKNVLIIFGKKGI